nr:MAG: polyprotein [Wufeng shrew picorna-like virus 12]
MNLTTDNERFIRLYALKIVPQWKLLTEHDLKSIEFSTIILEAVKWLPVTHQSKSDNGGSGKSTTKPNPPTVPPTSAPSTSTSRPTLNYNVPSPVIDDVNTFKGIGTTAESLKQLYSVIDSNFASLSAPEKVFLATDNDLKDDFSKYLADIMKASTPGITAKHIIKWTAHITNLLVHIWNLSTQELSPSARILSSLGIAATLCAIILEVLQPESVLDDESLRQAIINLIPTVVSDNSSSNGNQAIYPYRILKAGLTVVVLIIGYSATGGDMKTIKDFVALNQFKNALKDLSGDVSDLTEFIAEELCGLHFGPTVETIEKLTTKLASIDKVLLAPEVDFAKNSHLYMEMEGLYKSSSSDLKTLKDVDDKAVQRLLNMMALKNTSLLNKIEKVRVFLQVNTKRIDPPVFFLHGDRGCGKTTFIQYLIPKVAEKIGIGKDVYNVKFAENEYWTENGGQDNYFFEEVFDRGAKDPFITRFNSVASSSFYNMQGAFVKYQPCNPKVIYIASNLNSHIDLGKSLTPQAESAFWSRLGNNSYHMEFPGYNPAVSRSRQAFKSDWSHVKFYKDVWTTASPSSPKWTITSKTPVTIDDIVKEISDDYKQREAFFLSTITNQLDMGDNFVFHVTGEVGVGKSWMANFVGIELSRVLGYPLLSGTNSQLPKAPDERVIVVLDDVIPHNESDYLLFFNTLKQGSIILLTSNMKISRGLSCTRWGKPIVYKSMSAQQDGLVRRIGLTGTIWNDVNKSWAEVDDFRGVMITQTERGFWNFNGKKNTAMSSAVEIFNKYLDFISRTSPVKYVRGPTPQEAKIKLFFSDWEEAKNNLRSKVTMGMLLLNPTPKASISVDWDSCPELAELDPSIFSVHNIIDLERNQLEVVQNMFSRLRSSGYLHDVLVQIGDDKYYAKGDVVIHERMETSLEWVAEGDKLRLKSGGDQFVTEGSRVFEMLDYGLRDSSQIPFVWASLIQQHKDKLVGDADLYAYKAKALQTQYNIAMAKDMARKKTSILATLQQNPLATTLGILGVIGLTAGAAMMVWKAFTKTHVVSTTVENDSSLSTSTQFRDDYMKDYDLSERQATFMVQFRKSHGRNLASKAGPLELDAIRSGFPEHNADAEVHHQYLPPSNSDKLSTISDIVRAFNKALCIVTGIGSVKGINVVGRYVLTVAHNLGPDDDTYVHAKVNGVTRGFKAVLVYASDSTDTAVIKVVDKTWPMGADITKYFASEGFLKAVTRASIMTMVDDMIVTHTGPCRFYEQSIFNRTIARDSVFVLDFASLSVPPTQSGSCGLPYFAYDKSVGRHVCVAVHSAIVDDAPKCIGVSMTRERLSAMLDNDKTIVHQMAKLDIDTYSKPGLHEDVVKSSLFGKWLTEDWTKCNIPPTLGIYPIHKVKLNRALPRRHKFVATPYFDVPLGIPLDLMNTPKCISEVLYPEGLECTVDGKRSIPYTQVKKFEGIAPAPDFEPFFMAYNEFATKLHLDYGMDKLKPVSWHVAINGFPPSSSLYGQIEPLDMSTHPGILWSTATNANNKGHFFEGEHPNRKFANSEAGRLLTGELDAMWTLMVSGIRPFTLNWDKMKAELQPFIKTQSGSTRLFSVGDMAELLCVRRVLAPLMGLMKQRRFTCEAQIGVNPMPEYVDIMRRLKRTGSMGLSADFKRFDKNLSSYIIQKVVVAISKLYVKDIKPFFHVLYRMIAHSIHLCEDTVYIKEHGNNSGHYFTAGLNSLSVVLLIKYAFIKAYLAEFGTYPPGPVTSYITLVSHGDDFMASLSPETAAWLKVSKLAPPLKEIGLELTLGEAGVDHPVPLRDLWFLSRMMKDESNPHSMIIMPALKMSSITRHFFWTSEASLSQLQKDLNLILDEGGLHSEEVYNHLYNNVKRCVVKYGDRRLALAIDWRPWKQRREMLTSVILHGETFYHLFPVQTQTELEGECTESFLKKILKYYVSPPTGLDLLISKTPSQPVITITDEMSVFTPIEISFKGEYRPFRTFLELATMDEDFPIQAFWSRTKCIPYHCRLVETVSGRSYTTASYTDGRRGVDEILREIRFSNFLLERWPKLLPRLEKQHSFIKSNYTPLQPLDEEIPAFRVTHQMRTLADQERQPTTINQNAVPEDQRVARAPGASTVGASEGLPAVTTLTEGSVSSISTMNPFSPPSMMLAFGGIVVDLKELAYTTFIDNATTYSISASVAAGTIVFKIPYGPESLNEYAAQWVNSHNRYAGPFHFRIHAVGNAAFTGELLIGWVPDASLATYTVPELQKYHYCTILLNRNVAHEFVVGDARQDGFYRTMSDTSTKPGLIVMVYNELVNPYSDGGSVTLYLSTRLGNDFIVAEPVILPESTRTDTALSTSVYLLQGATLASLTTADTKVLLDGYRQGGFMDTSRFDSRSNRRVFGMEGYAEFFTGKALEGAGITGIEDEGNYIQVRNGQFSTDLPTLYLPYTDVTLDYCDIPVEDLGVNAIRLVVDADANLGILDTMNVDNSALGSITGSEFSSALMTYSSWWDGDKPYGGLVSLHRMDIAQEGDIGSYSKGTVSMKVLPSLGKPWNRVNNLHLRYIIGSSDEYFLPNDWLNVSFGLAATTLLDTMVPVLSGAPVVPQSGYTSYFHRVLDGMAQDRIVQFDLINRFSATPFLTVRYDPSLRSLCAFTASGRSMPYAIYNGASAEDIVFTNVKFVNATADLPPRKPTNFVSSVIVPDAAFFIARKVVHQMEAAIIAANAVGAAGSTAGGLFASKKQREHEKEMLEMQLSAANRMQLEKMAGQGVLQMGQFRHEGSMQGNQFIQDTKMAILNPIMNTAGQAYLQNQRNQQSLERAGLTAPVNNIQHSSHDSTLDSKYNSQVSLSQGPTTTTSLAPKPPNLTQGPTTQHSVVNDGWVPVGDVDYEEGDPEEVVSTTITPSDPTNPKPAGHGKY